MVPLNAFVMAMLSALLIHFMSMRRGVTAETIVLLGIALVFTFNALLALVQFFATEQAVAAVVFWTMGSLTKATWPKLGVICVVILITLPIFAKRAWALTALRLGDDKAASFGINVRSLRFQTLIMVSLLASFPVAFVGTIGFIGLVGPHIARMLIGEDQRFFPAGLAADRFADPVCQLGGQQNPDPRGDFSHRRGHVPDRRAVLHFSDSQREEKLMVKIQLDNLGARYGQREIIAGVSTATFSGGQVVAVVGPNAAGKSTLFKRMAGLIDGPGQVILQDSKKRHSGHQLHAPGPERQRPPDGLRVGAAGAQATDAGLVGS